MELYVPGNGMEIRPLCALGDLAGAQMESYTEETQHQHKAVLC